MDRNRKKILSISFALAIGVVYYFCLPDPLFKDPHSTVLEDREGRLLSASIASDGQWRFPEVLSVPDKFETALITFEDKRFYYHPGVDPISLARAVSQNFQSGKIVSGGSTLSMQVIRLAGKSKPRSFFQKVVEMVQATRLELRYSKKEILRLYASHAPFGGNVVGIDAACWRYFGRDPQALSWSEAAMLAVLPNAPALIHPGRNREALKRKRNTLLDKLWQRGAIDSLTCLLAKEESIPDEPKPLPRYARHLLQRAASTGSRGQRTTSTIDLPLQMRVEELVNDHHQLLKANQIYNACALVVSVETGEVLAYVGNTDVSESGYHGDEVDVITSPRSTGSILKPFLYAAMLDEGKVLRSTLLPDVPTIIGGFAPKNFSREYDGAVPADEALIRSLNVPAVHLLMNYRYEKLHSLLATMGMTTLSKPPDHYGLALILGGAEGTLWDITGIYGSLARTLNHYFQHPGKNRYDKRDYFPPVYRLEQAESRQVQLKDQRLEEHSLISASAIYETFDVLKELYRPGEESGWRHFSSAKKIAWKTGTSYGFRDAWAVGVTPEYVVGVWVGNADGEGRPSLTGTDAAAPLMFDIFSQMPGNQWFKAPVAEMEKIVVCTKSGMRWSTHCEKPDTSLVTRRGLQSMQCTFHQRVHLTRDKKYRVHSECESLQNIKATNWFVLPPVQEYYYKSRNIFYQPLPPMRQDCRPVFHLAAMDLIYPKADSKIFIPRELDGSAGSAVFELAHRDPEAMVYWHLDGAYLGATKTNHRMVIQSSPGVHKLTLVDSAGEVVDRLFEVVSYL